MRKSAILATVALLALAGCGKGTSDKASADQVAADDQAAAAEDVLHEQVAAEEGVTQGGGAELSPSIARNKSYILVANGASDEDCETAKTPSQIKHDQISCVTIDVWRQLCRVVIGTSSAAEANVAGGLASIGKTNNTYDALRSVALNNGATEEKFYWDNEKNTCKISFRLVGSYNGTSINESFVGTVSEIGIGPEGKGLVFNAVGDF